MTTPHDPTVPPEGRPADDAVPVPPAGDQHPLPVDRPAEPVSDGGAVATSPASGSPQPEPGPSTGSVPAGPAGPVRTRFAEPGNRPAPRTEAPSGPTPDAPAEPSPAAEPTVTAPPDDPAPDRADAADQQAALPTEPQVVEPPAGTSPAGQAATLPAELAAADPAPAPTPQDAPPAEPAEAVPARGEPAAAPANPVAVPEAAAASDDAESSDPHAGRVDDADPAPTSRRRRGRGLLLVLSVLVPLLAILVGFLAYLSVTTRGAAPVETSRRDALAASRSAARLIFSYDYRHLAKDFAAGRAVTTGKFTTDYDNSTKKVVTDFATRYKAVTVADVSNAGVESSSVDRVVALVFLNQQSSSTVQKTPKITQSRVRMTLVHRGGRWLVEAATVL